MNIRHIRRAVGLVVKSSMAELHFQNAAGVKLIVLNRPHPEVAAPPHVAMGGAVTAMAIVPVEPLQPARSRASPSRIVTSPMVGRFYHGTRHDGAPLAEVGERVEVGQPVGNVEMMRLMYAIRSNAAGTIEAVLVGDGEAVEYGQPLLRIA